MQGWLRDDELIRVLSEGRDDISRFARHGYRKRGRGTVAVTAGPAAESSRLRRYTLRYLRYDPARGLPGPETCRMIATYDPGREMVVQYARPGGGVRSVRLPARPDRGPLWRWFSLLSRLSAELAILLN